jgi:O-antigen ligase
MAVAANDVRWPAFVTPLDIARAGLVLTLLATPLPSGALMNLGLAVALAGALLHAWSRGVARRQLPAAVWLMVAFTGATAVSTLVAIDPWCGFAEPGGLLRAVAGRAEIPLWCGFRGLLDTTRSTLVFVLAVTMLDSERLRRAWLVGIIAVTCFVALSGFLEYALGHRTGGLFLRDAAIGHSNQTASYLLLALTVSVSVVMFGVFSGGARLLASVTLALGPLAVVLTQSLTAWVAGIVIIILLGLRIASRRALLIASALAMIITMILIVVAPTWEKFTAAWFAMSTGSRLSWWAGAMRVIGDHPWFGVGPRNFSRIDGATYGFQPSFHAHNLYFNIASEHGLVGLALLLVAVAAVAWRLKETHAAIVDDVDRTCWWAAACAVLAFALLGLATTPYHSRHAIMLWAIVGLFLAQFRDRPRPVPPT